MQYMCLIALDRCAECRECTRWITTATATTTRQIAAVVAIGGDNWDKTRKSTLMKYI